ncbi:transcription elongation factor GreB [Thiogranum longum]|uniref:Transcription elongation factor GreB n=1 Tax=Thiogranum longum TaxID=1537524 RepID=A0A4R1H7Y7_9GAMM|nr:transcription elongation factor GreB [Thiogranum longum]TCK17947.1 transcription elongation factor GreB [Thiogranum longum]
MGRYRPPQPESSLYITRTGYDGLQQELSDIWKRRAEVTKALSAAAAEGDRSENAEYIYRKKELREIDRRIRYLQKRLPELNVVSDPPSDQTRIFFGAWATLENDDGEEVTYRIVGPDEFDPRKGWISMDSPMARALMKKAIDDEVEVRIGERASDYRVLDVRYSEPGNDQSTDKDSRT